MDEGDLLVVVSGSGNSPNIIKALKTAKKLEEKPLEFLVMMEALRFLSAIEFFILQVSYANLRGYSFVFWPFSYEDNL